MSVYSLTLERGDTPILNNLILHIIFNNLGIFCASYAKHVVFTLKAQPHIACMLGAIDVTSCHYKEVSSSQEAYIWGSLSATNKQTNNATLFGLIRVVSL